MTNLKEKLEHNWRQKTLENLEKDLWNKSTFDSKLVTRCYELRKVILEKFTTEDLRLMIGQQLGLKYLLPLAIEILKKDLYSEGNLFPGDLLKSVLSINRSFWNENKKYWKQVDSLIKTKRQELLKNKISTIKFDTAFDE